MKKLLFILSLAFLNQYAHATKGGHGGISLLCYGPSGEKSAELFDLYQGKERPLSLEITRTGAPLNIDVQENEPVIIDKETQTAIEQALGKLKNYPQLKKDLMFYISLIKDKFIYTKSGRKLFNTNDLGDVSFLTIPDNCYPQNAATYASDGMIRVRQDIYSKLFTATDRAALIVHEALYKMLRINLSTNNSSLTRKIVAHMFANDLSSAESLQLKELTKEAYSIFSTSAITQGGNGTYEHTISVDPFSESSITKFRLDFSEINRNRNHLYDVAIACRVWTGANGNWTIVKDAVIKTREANFPVLEVEINKKEKNLKQTEVAYWCGMTGAFFKHYRVKIKASFIKDDGTNLELSSWYQDEEIGVTTQIYKFR